MVCAVGCGKRGETGQAGEVNHTVAPSITDYPAPQLEDGSVMVRSPTTERPPRDLGFELGARDAPVKVVEFSDFGCVSCRRFHMETFPSLIRDYIGTGQVHWTYLPLVSGMFTNSLEATLVAECAGAQGRFWQMTEMLYERHAAWTRLADPSPVFARMAREVGDGSMMDLEEFRNCVAQGRPMERIWDAMQRGTRQGVRGTPSFVIDGQLLVGARPVSVWVDHLEDRLLATGHGR